MQNLLYSKAWFMMFNATFNNISKLYIYSKWVMIFTIDKHQLNVNLYFKNQTPILECWNDKLIFKEAQTFLWVFTVGDLLLLR